MTTLQEAAEQQMTGVAVIWWAIDLRWKRCTLYHVQVCSGGRAVCGRDVSGQSSLTGWQYETVSIPYLARRVAERNLCSECIRLLAEYDFSSGKEPSRVKEPI